MERNRRASVDASVRAFARPLRSLAAKLAAGSLTLLCACTNAPGAEEGGNPRFDAAAPVATVNGAVCVPEEDAGSSAWSSLYADYFGPTGVASCAGSAGQCHGDANGLGAQASSYVCAGGVSGCYQGITSTAADLVTVGDTKGDPTATALYLTLRKTCGGGVMPLEPASFHFSATDMKRIADWIRAGAPDD
jgi:hypothetical protein